MWVEHAIDLVELNVVQPCLTYEISQPSSFDFCVGYFCTIGIFLCQIFYFGSLICLQDRTGKLASGAIANLVDVAGISVDFVEGLPMNVSVDMSISHLSTAKLDVSKSLPLKSPFLFDI